MTHLTEQMILSVRDREPVADEVVAHLGECATCARALKDARARSEAVERALAALTVPARRGRRDAFRGTRARTAVWSIRWLSRAAVLLLIGAGALSALPGPFNGWIPRMFPGSGPPDVAPASAEAAVDQIGGRMAVSSGPLVVRLENAVPGTVIEVRRVASRSVGVLAGTGSEFTYGGGEVRASVVAGPVTVELPEGVIPATLIVNGSVYLVADAAGMDIAGPTAADGEGLVTFMVPN